MQKVIEGNSSDPTERSVPVSAGSRAPAKSPDFGALFGTGDPAHAATPVETGAPVKNEVPVEPGAPL